MATVIDAIIHLTDQFTPNLTRIREELSETERITRRSAREIGNLGNSISSVGETMLPVAAAVAGGIGFSVKQFADFDFVITKAGLKADATEAEMKEMGDAVIAAGAKFPVTMSETANAMDRLAAGGFDAKQSIAALSPVIQAAVASGEDMGTVSDVVTSALSTWHLLNGDVAANAEMVADVIQMASNKSKLGVQDIGVAFQYAAAPAASLGDSVQTVAAILGVMANNGIEASTAGTSLRSAYLNLAAGAKPAREAIEKLGLQVFNANGEFKGMRPLLDQLREKIRGLSQEEATPILKDLFGTEGVSAVLAYINTAEEKTNEMFEAMKNAQGSSAAAFEVMSKTLSGQIKAIQGAFEAFVIRVGEASAPMLAPFVGSMQRLVDILRNMPDEQIQDLIKLGIGFIGITAGVLALGKALSILGSVSSFLAPIGKSLAEGATLGSLFAAKIAPIGTVFNSIKNVGVLALNELLAPMRIFGGLIAKGFTLVGNFGGLLGQVIGNIVGKIPLISAALSGVSSIFLKLGAVFAANPIGVAILAIAGIVFLVASNWKLFQNVAEVVWNKISYVVTQVVNTLSSTFENFKTRMSGHFERLIELWNRLTGSGESSGENLTMVVNTLGSVFTAVFTVIGSVVELVFAELETVINGIMGVFEGLITFFTGVFTGDWYLVWDGIKQIVLSVVGTIVETVENMVAAVEDAIARLRGQEATSTKRLQDARAQKVINQKRESLIEKGAVKRSTIEAFDKSANVYIPGQNALGTDYWKGGLTWVHEQGAEIIDLPTGARVIPHSSSLKEEYRRGATEAVQNFNKYSYLNNLDSSEHHSVNSVNNSSVANNTLNNKEVYRRDVAEAIQNFNEYSYLSNLKSSEYNSVNSVNPVNNALSNSENNIASNIENNSTNNVQNTKKYNPLFEVFNNQNNNSNNYFHNGDGNSNIQEAESTGNPTSNITTRKDDIKPPISVNVNIPKLADEIVVREKSDIDNLVNQLVYRFQAHAINRVVHAVR